MGLSSCTENQLLIVLFDKKFCVTIFTRCLFVYEAVESSQTLFIIYTHRNVLESHFYRRRKLLDQ